MRAFPATAAAGLFAAATAAAAFQCSSTALRTPRSIGGLPASPPSTPSQRRRPSVPLSSQDDVGVDVGEDAEDAEEEYELIEFVVTPEQIALLRKEANRREAARTLPKYYLPAPENGGEVSQETADEVLALFQAGELLDLRGVSKGAKKRVFNTAYAIADTLEDVYGKPVVVVEVKGFAARLYCPWDEEERVGRLRLRSSYKPGQWTNKAKPLRDARGQIVQDASGNNIKV